MSHQQQMPSPCGLSNLAPSNFGSSNPGPSDNDQASIKSTAYGDAALPPAASHHAARKSVPSSGLQNSLKKMPGKLPGKSPARKKFWLKQLHSWHWISAAVSLSGMLVFSVTGITLNHAATISAKPDVVTVTAALPASLTGLLSRAQPAENAPLPPPIRAEVGALVGIDTGSTPAEWSDGEVYVAIPGPGSDAWVSIDRQTGAIEAEKTDRGWVSFFNDLHKGRNTGSAWFWLIDVLAVACVIFTITGLLLLQLHAKNRPSTWPLVGIGTAVPAAIIVLFMHF